MQPMLRLTSSGIDRIPARRELRLKLLGMTSIGNLVAKWLKLLLSVH
jgi:hypothetical protein